MQWGGGRLRGGENDGVRGSQPTITVTPADGTTTAAFSMLGDVVVVRNSGEETVDPANGLNGWNLSWAQWKAGSAVQHIYAFTG